MERRNKQQKASNTNEIHCNIKKFIRIQNIPPELKYSKYEKENHDLLPSKTKFTARKNVNNSTYN